MDFDTIPDGDEPGYEQPQFDNVAGDDIVEGSDNYYEVEDSAEEVPVLPPPVPQMDFLPEPEAPVLPDPELEENALT